MATFFVLCGLLITVISYSQGSFFGRSTDIGGECSEPPENGFYENGQYDRPCERLAAAFRQYVHLERQRPEPLMVTLEPYPRDRPLPGSYEAFVQDLSEYTGIDVEDDEQILGLACQLEDVHTLDDLVDTINTAYVNHRGFRPGYKRFQTQLAAIDGFHGFAKGWQIRLEVQQTLRQLTGRGDYEELKFSEVRDVMNEDILAGILRHLEEVFGSGYLVYYLMRPYNDALVGVDHHLLARALMERSLTCLLGMKYGIHEEFNAIEDRVFGRALTFDVLHNYVELYVAADQIGLFNLS